jgi:hypothetical protein
LAFGIEALEETAMSRDQAVELPWLGRKNPELTCAIFNPRTALANTDCVRDTYGKDRNEDVNSSGMRY